jgi:hypothetical protein
VKVDGMKISYNITIMEYRKCIIYQNCTEGGTKNVAILSDIWSVETNIWFSYVTWWLDI